MKIKSIVAWAGIIDDEFDYGRDPRESFKDTTYGIYKNRKEAKTHYKQVIKVRITPIK